jgi:cellulose synthase operon protein C
MNRRIRIVMGSATLALLLSGALALGDDKKPRTLKDLETKEVPVQKQPPTGIKPEQAIEQYRRFLELNSNDPKLRAEAMRRLGDLQVEVNDGSLAEGVTSGLELKEAIELYENLLKTYPDFARADTVMYQLSRAYEAQGQPDKALAVLDRLTTKYPSSQWLIEGQFRRGEILFSEQRYADAERAYGAVVRGGLSSGFYDQGLYKRGWSLFKMNRTEDSVESFLKVLDRVLVKDSKLRPRESLTRPETELTDDAYRALSIQMLDLDGPVTLDETLKRRGDPVYAHQLYEALGNLYIEKERYQDAAVAYEAFAKRRPEDRYAPSLQMRTIQAYEKGGFASLVIEGKQAFVERYAFGKPFWAKRTPEDAPEVVTELKSNLKDLAQYYHAEAQKTKKPEDYALAARWYRQMLDSFPKDPEAPGTRYLLAEVLFDSGHFAEAAREYEHTAYDYPPHPKAEPAGYAALVAYQKHEATLTGESKALWHRQSIESEVMFATSFPADPETPAVMMKADEELFALNESDRVIELSRQILDRKPLVDAKKQRTATTLLAHSLFDKGRYTESETAYVGAVGLVPMNDPDRAALVERVAASIYKQGEAKRDAGDANGAVEDFLRVGKLAPTAKIRSTAEYDAATLLVNGQQWQRATEVLEAFRRNYPQNSLTPEVTRKLAVAYLESGRSSESAAEFERIAARPEETPDVRRDSLWQAAKLYDKAGNTAGAARAYSSYVQQFPAPLDPAMEARQRMADIAKASNDSRARSQWVQEIIRADKAAGAARTDRSRYLAAKAMLETIDPAVAEFNSIKLVTPLNKSLKAKRVAMEKVLTMYGQALDYKVAEVTTAATFGMAELYRKLGADVMSSERPKEIAKDADAREQYDVLLEEQAYPFEEKAIQLHEVNAQHASEGIYDEWVQKSFEALAKLKPARYAKAEVSEDHAASLR